MSSSVVIRGLLSVALLGSLVIGDPMSAYTLSSAKVETRPNDYFDSWSIETFPSKKNNPTTITLPTKKELPATMMIKLIVKLGDDDPTEYELTVCDTMEISTVRSTIEKIGKPADTFPKTCPFGPGNWTLLKAVFPTDLIPPHIPDGPFTLSILIFEEDKEPYVQIDAEGKLFHDTPLGGR